MLSWISKFRNAKSETKQFVITVIILAIIVFGSLIWAFGRLDYVRSTKPPSQTEAKK